MWRQTKAHGTSLDHEMSRQVSQVQQRLQQRKMQRAAKSDDEQHAAVWAVLLGAAYDVCRRSWRQWRSRASSSPRRCSASAPRLPTRWRRGGSNDLAPQPIVRP